MPVQKAVAIALTKKWLKKILSTATFANSILPEKQCRVPQLVEEIKNLPEYKTDLIKRNILDRYLDKPDEKIRKGREIEKNVLRGIYL